MANISMGHDHIERSTVDYEKGPKKMSTISVNLKKNVDAKIHNPLAGLARHELLQNVDEFAEEQGLVDIAPLLRKGGLVAQNPDNLELIEDLDASELKTLHKERTHKWTQPRALYLTVILCSVCAAVQGWDQTGSNGANLSFPEAFDMSSPTGIDPWIMGLVNAAPYYDFKLSFWTPHDDFHIWSILSFFGHWLRP